MFPVIIDCKECGEYVELHTHRELDYFPDGLKCPSCGNDDLEEDE